jgi:hypothetical protein
MSYLLLFHCNNGCTNVTSYVHLPVLFNFGTSGQLHDPAASSPGYEPPVSFEEVCMFLTAGLYSLEKRNLLLVPAIKPRFLCPPTFLFYVCFK